MLIYDNFMKIMKCKIKGQVKLKPDQVTFNQTVLKSVIETIILCRCHALRVHRYDPQFSNNPLFEFISVNVRNFLELIRFRVAAGDGILKRRILKALSACPKLYKMNQEEIVGGRNCYRRYFRS